MLGYPAANASFHMLEVMASPRFHQKQVGYLAASQCFNQETDVLILATNMIKKDLRSSQPLDVAVALNGLSHIATPDLAQHLAPDVVAMLNHSRAPVRKKAVLALASIIAKYPDALQQSWDRLRDRLEDAEQSVVSATVNVICELARRDPKAFLPLSPQFFQILTTSTNNWMLIKIIKLFGALTPHEPRLVKKLLPPITTIIQTTPAMSLLYECMHTVIIGGMLTGPGGDELASTCVEKLATFLDDEDQNLKYIALLALVKILPSHPHLVALHRDTIFESVEDPDLSIRLRALDLVSGMASRSNLQDIIQKHMAHLEPTSATSAASSLKAALGAPSTSSSGPSPFNSASYRLEIVTRILRLGAHDTYANIVDFEWYVDTLVRLARIAKVVSAQGSVGDGDEQVGAKIRDQLIDVTMRVRGVRAHAVERLRRLLEDADEFLDRARGDEGEVLHAAAWCCGEYCAEVPYPPALILPMVRRNQLLIDKTSSTTRAALIHNGVKLFAWWAMSLSEKWEEPMGEQVRELAKDVGKALEDWCRESTEAEVLERAMEYRALFRLIEVDLDSYCAKRKKSEAGVEDSNKVTEKPIDEEGVDKPRSLHLLSPLFFGHALGPVAKKAQAKVGVPLGLDLENWIVEPSKWSIVLDNGEDVKGAAKGKVATTASPDDGPADAEEQKRRLREAKEARLRRERASPFYLSDEKTKRKEAASEDLDDVPIVQLTLDDLGLPMTKDKSKNGEAVRDEAPAPASASTPPVLEKEEMPSDGEEAVVKKTVAVKSKKGKKKRSEVVV